MFLGHSQGNLVLNRVYFDRLSTTERGKTFGISVATPDDRTPGGSLHTTLDEDNLIEILVPFSLNGNTSNGPCGSWFACHDFTTSYLKPNATPPQGQTASAPQISQTLVVAINQALATTSTLNQPPTAGFTMGFGLQTATDGQTLNLTVAPGGSATVSLDASTRSTDVQPGFVAEYQWRVDGTLQSGVLNSIRQFSLDASTHSIQLVVVDNQGASSLAATGTVIVNVALPGPRYTITDLGVLPGGDSSGAESINAAGVVVGKSSGTSNPIGGYSGCGSPITDLPFIWTPNVGIQGLGTPPVHDSLGYGPCHGSAQAINDQGAIVGTLGFGQPSHVALFRPFIWTSSEGMKIVPFGNNTGASDINNLGTVVGNDGSGAFRWSPPSSGMQYGGGGFFARATAINDLGTAAGAVTGGTGCFGGPFVWDISGQVQGLSLDTLLPPVTILCSQTLTEDISNSGVIVGSLRIATSSGGISVAWIFKNNTAQSLGHLPLVNDGSNEALGINDNDVVVGTSNSKAFVWSSLDGMQDLNILTHASTLGWTLDRATAINQIGQIVGSGVHNGLRRAFLLNPIP